MPPACCLDSAQAPVELIEGDINELELQPCSVVVLTSLAILASRAALRAARAYRQSFGARRSVNPSEKLAFDEPRHQS